MKVLNRSERIIAPRADLLFSILDLYMLDFEMAIIFETFFIVKYKIVRCIF